MNKDEKFFSLLWEIWYNIINIDFLMRCAIMQKNNETDKFIKPPYDKGRVYKIYPESFSWDYFWETISNFESNFPKYKGKLWIIKDFRNAMAHGFIFEINENWFNQLIKLKSKKWNICIESNISLKNDKLEPIRDNIVRLRKFIAKLAKD